MTVRTILAITTLIASGWLVTLPAAEPIAVARVAGGREFHGQIDASSNGNELILRTESPGITLKRGLRWERIDSLTVGGVQRDPTTLRAELGNRPAEKRQPSLLSRIDLHAWPVVNAIPPANEQQTAPPPKVATVGFDPQIANWDADVETDGVVIDVAPLDANGNLRPVGGTLEVELFAPQRRVFDQAPQSGGDTLELVERWTRAITPDDYGPRGARLQLPFGAITPELQPNWTASAYGLVHSRLSIPGHGVFASSRDGVRVRPWAPNRDRLEMKTGQRFLSTEQMGRHD